MKILHVMKNDKWNKTKHVDSEEYLGRIGFIPCCTDETLKYVLQYYLSIYTADELIILEIDTDRMVSEIKWEEWNKSGNYYPHVYGAIERKAIINVYRIDEWNKRKGDKK